MNWGQDLRTRDTSLLINQCNAMLSESNQHYNNSFAEYLFFRPLFNNEDIFRYRGPN